MQKRGLNRLLPYLVTCYRDDTTLHFIHCVSQHFRAMLNLGNLYLKSAAYNVVTGLGLSWMRWKNNKKKFYCIRLYLCLRWAFFDLLGRINFFADNQIVHSWYVTVWVAASFFLILHMKVESSLYMDSSYSYFLHQNDGAMQRARQICSDSTNGVTEASVMSPFIMYR